MIRSVDHVVVGAGSAGCLVARRLSDAGQSVALLEAGPDGPEPAGIRSPNWLRALAEPGWTWPNVKVRRPRGIDQYWRGRGLGGSSAVNGLVALAGPIDDYLPWLGHEAEVQDAIATVMDDLRPTRVPLGFLARELGVAPADLTLRNGKRNSAATVYLTDASNGLIVQGDTEVDRLQINRGVVGGVVLRDGSEIDADSVWICAGAVHSPGLLRRSGVSHAAIGQGLQDHVANRFEVQIPESNRRPNERGDVSPISGLLTLSSGIIDPASGESSDGDTQMLVLDHGSDPGHGTVLAAVMRIESIGHLTETRDGALIAEPNMLDHPLDQKRLAWITAEVTRRLDDAGLDYQPNGLGDYVHAVGTCAMGSVVNGEGQIDGYAGLRVVDASVIPRLPRANTHVPTLVVAECLTRRALAE